MFGVRYIAINDNVDTDRSESTELMPFKNLFNEWCIRDTSRKKMCIRDRREGHGTKRSHSRCVPNDGRKQFL